MLLAEQPGVAQPDLAAARLGYRCQVLTPEPDSPAGQVAAGVTLGDYEDTQALYDFATRVDVITFEFENVSAAGLELLLIELS